MLQQSVFTIAKFIAELIGGFGAFPAHPSVARTGHPAGKMGKKAGPSLISPNAQDDIVDEVRLVEFEGDHLWWAGLAFYQTGFNHELYVVRLPAFGRLFCKESKVSRRRHKLSSRGVAIGA